MCIPWGRTRTLHYCLTAPPLSLHPLPSLISSCLNLPFATQGRPWRLKPIPYKQETGNTERLPCPRAPQNPAWFQGWELFSNIFGIKNLRQIWQNSVKLVVGDTPGIISWNQQKLQIKAPRPNHPCPRIAYIHLQHITEFSTAQFRLWI